MIASLLLSAALALSPAEHSDEVRIHEVDLQLEMSLDALEAARAPEDARRNWSEGRRHLLGVYGYTSVVPGGAKQSGSRRLVPRSRLHRRHFGRLGGST